MFEQLKRIQSKIIFRITVAFFVGVFLPIFLFLIFGFMRINKMLDDDNYSTARDSLRTFEQSLYKQVSHYDGVIDSIAKSENIIDYIKSPSNEIQAEKVSSFLDEFTLLQSGVYKAIDFYVYMDDEYALTHFGSMRSIQNEAWCIDFFAANVAEQWSPDLTDGDYALIKTVKLFDQQQRELGVVRIKISLNQVIHSVVYLSKDKNRLFVITEDGGDVYFNDEFAYHSEMKTVTKNYDDTLVLVRHGSEQNVNLKKTIVALKPISKFSIIIGSCSLKSENAGGYIAAKGSVFFMILILSIFAVIFYYYIIKIFATLKRDIEQVGGIINNNSSGRLLIRHDNEIGDIERQYNVLLDKIEKLTKSIVLKERMRKNAEISMLQSQMNPHFIYNVINHFRMQAEINKDYEMANAIAKFGKLMRYSMMNRDYITTLKEELQYLKHFLELETLRFPGQVEFEINHPSGLERIKVPKFILQPIVENSIKYAKRTNHILRIEINITETENDVCISIRDNGNGVDDSTVRLLNSQFESGYYRQGNEISTKIGLKNINQRISLIYNNDYRLSVNSEQGKFFEVFLRIPME